MYKIVTVKANAKELITVKMHLAPHMYKTVTLKVKCLRKSLLYNAWDSKYVQNHYCEGKC